MASSTGARLSREEYKKAQELDAARKAGTAAPEVDEEGNEINPHIPQYIAQAPWYLNKNKPSLSHQRLKGSKGSSTINDWNIRGAAKGPAATKFRKGACTNCGAMTHDAKSCTDRPRKVGAKFNNKNIKADEVVMDVKLDFEGVHDRWRGYDTSEHHKIIEQFQKTEEERKKIKAQQYVQNIKDGGKEGEEADKKAEDSDAEDNDDNEFKETGEEELAQKFDSTTRTTVRNLRIREDTAKYLRNLDLSSAHYDPKTRSMRENPYPNANPADTVYAGDNFVRATGDVQKFNDMQLYSMHAYDKGQDVHFQAAPSQAELLYQDFKVKKESVLEKQKQAVLDKYGGEEHLKVPPKELIFSQTEEYREYARDGKLLKGREKAVPRSSYEEDVLINNHTAIWGSYWNDGRWGYGCCHQLVKNSYCTGEAGKQAAASAPLREALSRPTLEEQAKDAKAKGKKDEPEEDSATKLKKALAKEEERNHTEELDERKRKYNWKSGDTYEVSDEQMEAYRLKRQRTDDPMAKFLDDDND